MSGNFYLVLGYSLMLTLGAVFIYFGYRFLKARIGKKGASHPYVTLHNLEKGKAAGEIIFYFSVPEKMHVKLDILNT